MIVIFQGRVSVSQALLLQNFVAEESTDSQLPLSRVKVSTLDSIILLILFKLNRRV